MAGVPFSVMIKSLMSMMSRLPEFGEPWVDTKSSIAPELMAEMERAAELAVAGMRDLEAMRTACAQMDRRRKEIFRRNGLLDIGTPAIRELRDGDRESREGGRWST